jgi:sortase A
VSAAVTETPAEAGKERTPGVPSASRSVALSILLLALLIVGFVGYLLGVSGIQEASDQHRLYTTLVNEFGQEIGPLGPTKPGSPVAVMNIPAIGVKDMVVVEGTSPEDLTAGPGHLRNTPLPGQIGMSVIYGRRVTFGAPFGQLIDLRPGDEITTITQQGRSVYKVAAIGDSQHPVLDQNLNRLVLLTASSTNVPAYYLEVDADLVSRANNGPVQMPVIGPTEKALAGDPGALIGTMIWGLALVILAVGGAVAAAQWSPWLTYLVVVPAVLAVVWNMYENLAALLPNLY